MKHPSHLSGFTLIEVLIALSLTALVLTMGFWVYRVFIGYQQGYQGKVEQGYEVLSARFAIRQAVQASDGYWIAPSEHLYLLLRDSVTCEFRFEGGELLLVKGATVDTLDGQGWWEAGQTSLYFYWVDTAAAERYIFQLPSAGRARPSQGIPNPVKR